MPAATTITATQGGSTANGMQLTARAVTGAAVASLQGGTAGTATQTGAAAHETSLTTTTTSSLPYMAAVDFVNTSFTADANTTAILNTADATNNRRYTGGRATSNTGATPGAITLGFTAPTDNGGLAVVEILPATIGTSVVDGAAFSATALNGTSAHNAAPYIFVYGTLLVLLISSNGGAGQTTMSVSDTFGLTWTELIRSNTAGAGYCGVWVAQAPYAPTPGPILPGQTWLRQFRRHQVPPPVGLRLTESLPATVTTTGAQSNAVAGNLDAAVTTSGTVQQAASKTLTVTTTATAALTRALARSLAATTGTAATVARAVAKVLPGSAGTSGTLSQGATKALAVTVTTAGSLTRGVTRTFAVTVSTAGALLRSAGKALKATVATVASLVIPPKPPEIHHATVTITPAGPLAAQVAITAATTAEVTITAAGNSAATVTITPN